MDWNRWWGQIQNWLQTHEALWGWVGLLSVITLVGTLIAVLLILILLPRRYLLEKKIPTRTWPLPLRILCLAAKNFFGIFFILAGLAMLLLPGQGLLTLFLGVVLVDLPAKRRLMRRIVRQQNILHNINRLRAKANQPPLETPNCDRPRSSGSR
jgi:hypothetical protein